ncbi:MAG: hypothetical protein CBB97_14775 [Candidatus Endolissoclinum sp. TMED37]|nr:MAG: hypothetical protein CBB97_14775 [Candidatus Endolissoclinum sp. TMED37]
MVLYFLKVLVILAFILVKLKIIPTDLNALIIIDDTFRIFLAILLMSITSPLRGVKYEPDYHDNMLMFIVGILFLLTVDFREYGKALKYAITRKKDK